MKTNSLEFDAQTLREKILDLAMRGKLVKQDPTDEPASVLLEKIKKEKEELVKEGKIKKSKKLPEITDDEKPFDIPDSWEWVRLGEVSNIFAGGDKPSDFSKYQDDNHNYEIFSNGVKNHGLYGYTNFPKVNSKAITVSARGTIGHVEIRNRPFLPIIRLITVIPFNEKITDFLSYYLQSITTTSDGSSIPQLTVPKLKPELIPLPPLEEQSRIAAKIAELFALLRKVESSNQQYDEFKKMLRLKVLDLAVRGKLVKQNPDDEPASVLLEKIKAEKAELIKEGKIKKSKKLPEITDDEKPFDIPDSWEWARWNDVLDVRDGTHDTPKYVNEGIPLVTGKNLKNGKIVFSPINYISENDANKIDERSKVDKNDIIFAMIGTIGNPVLVNTDNRIAIKNIALLKSIFSINMKYIYYYVLMYQKYLKEGASGGNQKFVSLLKLKKSLICIPPLEEQNRIVKVLDELKEKIG